MLPKGWFRTGGHEYQFFATPDEILETFSRVTSKRWPPLFFFLALNENYGTGLASELYPLEKLSLIFEAPYLPPMKVVIVSPEMSPSFPTEKLPDYAGEALFYGALEFQPSRLNHSPQWMIDKGFAEKHWTEHRISATGRYYNPETDEEINHPEYLRLFGSLKRALKAQERYTSWVTFPNSPSVEITSPPFFTEVAYRQEQEGIFSFNLEGR